jgi:hypothetical protein
MDLPCKTCLVLPLCKNRNKIEFKTLHIAASHVERIIDQCEKLKEYFDVDDLRSAISKDFLKAASKKRDYNQKMKCFCKVMGYDDPIWLLFKPDYKIKRRGQRIVRYEKKKKKKVKE